VCGIAKGFRMGEGEAECDKVSLDWLWSGPGLLCGLCVLDQVKWRLFLGVFGLSRVQEPKQGTFEGGRLCGT